MTHHLGAVAHIDQAMSECIDNCSDCHDVCVATVEHCLSKGGEHAAAEHIRTLLDCAQACDVSRDFMLRGSELHHAYCGACAEACERCAQSCEQLAGDDEVMRHCADTCRRCAESCRAMAGTTA
jgi:hypothetical protein